MEKPVLVSVIIPSYNHGIYLPEAIKSVEDTGFSDLEIIIIDDGSTEPASQEMSRSLAEKGYRVVVQKNSGVAASRNHGIRLAKGRYIIPLDADNHLLLPYLAEGIAVLESQPGVGVVFGDARIFGEKEGTWVNHPLQLREILFENYIDNCAIFRREAWESVGGYDENAPFHTREDWFFWLDLLDKGWTFHYLNQFCFEYRFLHDSKVRRKSASPENQRIIAEYIYPKQERLIGHFFGTGALSGDDRSRMLRLLNRQLAYYHFRGGSLLKAYRHLLRAMGQGLSPADGLKLGLGWPFLRWKP